MGRIKKIKNSPEVLLYGSKWFDYRHLRPVACDIAFLLEFSKEGLVHNDLIGKTRYRNQLSKLDIPNLEKWRYIKCMRRLRMFADKHGIPYDLYWQFSYRALRNMSFKRDTINIFANKALKEKVVQYWDEVELSIIIKSKAKIFDVDIYQQLDIQDEYFKYVLKKVVDKYGNNENGLRDALTRMVLNKDMPLLFIVNSLNKMIGDGNE